MKLPTEIKEAKRVIRRTRLTPEQLKDLVFRAQRYDEEALLQLCMQYKGTIIKLCKRQHIKNVLGKDDAKQYCYLYLLEIIQHYHGDRWDILPGLFYIYIWRKLLKQYKKELKIVSSIDYLEDQRTSTEANYRLVIADDKTFASLDKALLEKLLKRLSDKEQYVMNGIFYADKTLKVLAKELNMSEDGVYYYKARALNKLLGILLSKNYRYEP